MVLNLYSIWYSSTHKKLQSSILRVMKKGIRIGDQILAINSIRVFGMSHFKVCDLLFKKTANQFLTLLVKKKGGYYNGVHYIPPKCYYCGHTSLNQMTLSVIYCTNCKNHM